MSTFQEMPIHESIQKALTKLKFTEPTEVQSVAIPLALTGEDFMACAQTGSGKTAAYGIPVIAALLENEKKTALILAPTRELVQQIANVLRDLTIFCRNTDVCCLVGGADMRKQLRALTRRPRIIVATPGRLTDHLRRKSLHLNNTAILVLDEGDRMLDMGFAPQLDAILKFLPQKRQTLLFTATLPPKVKKLCEKYLCQPKSISVGKASQPVETIKQSIIQTTHREKDDKLVDELNKRQGSIIIFTKTKRRTDSLAKSLSEFGFAVGRIHGGRTQGQRNQAISGFRKGQYRILCATDVAARGIDIPQVEHVINYDLPMMDEDYVHRIGRTARNGASGEALSFVLPQDHHVWRTIARKYNIGGVELAGGSDKGGRSKPRGPRDRGNFRNQRKRRGAVGRSSRFGGHSSSPRA